MTLYRATYATPTGTRHATFAAACDSEAARYADMLRLSDRVQAVDTIRELERPVFDLTSEATA